MVQPSAEPQDWERALEGLEFPVSLSEIRKRARDVGGVDLEVHAVVGRLQNDSYDSFEQLLEEIRNIYIDDDVPPDKLPL